MARRVAENDWVVVGSGFGGSVAALRLAQRGYSVEVVEQGRRFREDDFPSSAWDLRRFLWAPRLGLRGIMRMQPFRDVSVIAGVGVGGGSLVYANTLYVPHSDDFYRHAQWAELADWRAELEPHFRTAERMLGVVDYEGEGPSELLMKGVAEDLGVPDAVRPTRVGVYFGEPGTEVDDPYFGGAGPRRTGCTRIGRCLLGCPVGAKNSLVKNYLWFAERLGVTVSAERTAIDVRPAGAPDGSDGYVVASERSGAWLRRGRREHRARVGVVLAGGALGTNELLRRCRDGGSLPRLSDRLGHLVRTNSEAITAATAREPSADYASGIAITASLYPEEGTHVTNNTYGGFGDAIALTFGPLTDGTRRLPRPLQLLRAYALHPLLELRRARPRGWSRRTIVFTTMQSADNAIRLRPARFGRLQTEVDPERPIEATLPVANRVAELAARRMGGWPQSAITESLRNAPTTAHILGGAVIGSGPENGVVDRRRRAFGYRNLLVCDGASVPANPGVNPSLTITAMAEEAMTHVPPA
jgi:cholesterol oxidase